MWFRKSKYDELTEVAEELVVTIRDATEKLEKAMTEQTRTTRMLVAATKAREAREGCDPIE